MSFQAMTWAVEQELPALQKLVLLMLANCCNHHTGQCNPSHERLARECGMSKESIKRSISELAEKGLLDIQRRVQEGISLPNQYRLNIRGGGVSQTRGWGLTDPGVGSHRPTNQEVEPGIETSTIPASPKRSKKSQIPENFTVSESVQRWANEKGFKNLAEHLEFFVDAARARGYTYVNWDAAFMNCIRKNWAGLGEKGAGLWSPRDDWHKSDSGTDRKGRELGMAARAGESYSGYRDRIFEKLRSQVRAA